MKAPLKEPCHRCPFRRVSVPGYLGASTPNEFVMQVLTEQKMPCHCTVDYRQTSWREELDAPSSEARFCAGALVFSANICKSPRDPAHPRLPADRVAVFSSPAEFLAHHHDWQNGEEPKVDMEEVARKRKALFSKKVTKVTKKGKV